MPIAHELDLTGMKCPMPLVHLTKGMREVACGDEVTAIATDPAFRLDVEAWCERTGHSLIELHESDDRIVATIRKSDKVG